MEDRDKELIKVLFSVKFCMYRTRILALGAAVCLAIPSPVFALRIEAGYQSRSKAGLEQALGPAAGLENLPNQTLDSESILAIELGGTWLRSALISGSTGDIIQSSLDDQLEEITSEQVVLRQVREQVDSLLNAAKLTISDVRVSVSVRGDLDEETGYVARQTALPFSGQNLRERIASVLGAQRDRVVISQDMKAATWAEAVYGSGQTRQLFGYISVSTGINAAYFFSGNVFGPKNWHFDARQMALLRDHVSGAALARLAQDRIDEPGGDSIRILAGGDASRIEGRHVGEAFSQDNPLAVDIVHGSARILGEAIVRGAESIQGNGHWTDEPELLMIVGGGVAQGIGVPYVEMILQYANEARSQSTSTEVRKKPIHILLSDMDGRQRGLLGAAVRVNNSGLETEVGPLFGLAEHQSVYLEMGGTRVLLKYDPELGGVEVQDPNNSVVFLTSRMISGDGKGGFSLDVYLKSHLDPKINFPTQGADGRDGEIYLLPVHIAGKLISRHEDGLTLQQIRRESIIISDLSEGAIGETEDQSVIFGMLFRISHGAERPGRMATIRIDEQQVDRQQIEKEVPHKLEVGQFISIEVAGGLEETKDDHQISVTIPKSTGLEDQIAVLLAEPTVQTALVENGWAKFGGGYIGDPTWFASSPSRLFKHPGLHTPDGTSSNVTIMQMDATSTAGMLYFFDANNAGLGDVGLVNRNKVMRVQVTAALPIDGLFAVIGITEQDTLPSEVVPLLAAISLVDGPVFIGGLESITGLEGRPLVFIRTQA